MPCLNEIETIAACIGKAQAAFATYGIAGEIVVADNGSTDGSQECARRLGARVVPVPERGYGAALTGGIAAARGTYVIMGDADDSYDFGAIQPFLEKLREGYDLVMGCRLPAGGGVIMPGAMPWQNRYLGNPVLSGLGKLFFRSGINDFHCGLRGFSKAAFLRMRLATTGMEYASEMVIKATLLGMRIAEIPITLHKDGRSRPPHLRRWRDGWRHLRFMLMYAPMWLFLTPGAILLAGGSAMFALLAAGPLHVGGVTLDTNTLLVSAMLMLLGLQLVSFFLVTKSYSVSVGLLPADARLESFLGRFSLERGIGCGTVLMAAGAGLLLAAVGQWARHDFGPLSYPDSLRMVIPSVTLITMGMQTIFTSFLISIVRLKRQ